MTENLMSLHVFSGCALSAFGALAGGGARPLDATQRGCARKHIAHAMNPPPSPR